MVECKNINWFDC